ncbi:hypothetical protein M9Y10_006077 [Tritrichomonas musculus]|uniref:Myb-like domain-containing protein n=1 Tax=Tritrichomonas musculus TaxID=1915356 RepID=A0ABR2JD83_9EUKA
MNNASQIPFPYRPPVIKVKQSTRKINVKEGIKRPIEKYEWISEGSLKPIEKGLPLIFGSKVSHSFEDIEISHKRFTDFVNQYKQFKSEDDFDDNSFNNDENEEVEDIEEIYNPFKFLTDKIAEEQKVVEESEPHRTGISQSPLPANNDTKSSIIDSIGPIKFSSVKPSHEIKKPLYMSPFYHPRYEARVTVPTKSTVPVLKQQLKRVFKPDNAPFENVDKSEDFPTTMLLPMVEEKSQSKRAQSEFSMIKRKNRIINPKNAKNVPKTPENSKEKISALDSDDSASLLITEMRPDMYSKDTFANDENAQKDENKKNNNKSTPNYDDLKGVPSTLIDPSKDDVFWTRNKVPFTRNDIDHIFSWQVQNDAIMSMIDEKRQKKLDEREKALLTTFESKEAFAHAIELVDKECQRLVYLGPGKSVKNKKSFWIEAAKYAKNDKSSLMYRKKKWNEFTREIQNSFNLLVNQSKSQNKNDCFYSSPDFKSVPSSNINQPNLIPSNSRPNINNDSNENGNINENISIKQTDKSINNEDEDVYNDDSLINIDHNKNIENESGNNNGLMKNQVDFILRYKSLIMSGKAVDSTTFWNVIEPFQATDFTHTEFCILVEILRSQLGVTKSEIITYLEEKEFPVLFYHLASTSPDFQPITNYDDEIDQKINKKKKNSPLLKDTQSSSVFNAMQKRQQILEQAKSPHKQLLHS